VLDVVTDKGTSNWLLPDWPAPENVKAVVTTRLSGHHSHEANPSGYSYFNLAAHVNDSLENVQRNRQTLADYTGIAPSRFSWLEQIHGQHIVPANGEGQITQADGSDTREENLACVVMTADCLPVLLCDLTGTQVAAVHAGWRGLAEGILSKAVQRFHDSSQVIAWLGPAISQKHFEVGEDVYQAFVAQQPQASKAFVSVSGTNKWMADIYLLARLQLNSAGLEQVYGGDFCTYADAEHFYSYRRDGQQSGRMASLIWKQASGTN